MPRKLFPRQPICIFGNGCDIIIKNDDSTFGCSSHYPIFLERDLRNKIVNLCSGDLINHQATQKCLSMRSGNNNFRYICRRSVVNKFGRVNIVSYFFELIFLTKHATKQVQIKVTYKMNISSRCNNKISNIIAICG